MPACASSLIPVLDTEPGALAVVDPVAASGLLTVLSTVVDPRPGGVYGIGW